jgi:hypothetical protein
MVRCATLSAKSQDEGSPMVGKLGQRLRVIGLGMVLCTIAMPAFAQMISSRDPDGIAKLLRDRGQNAIITVDEFNDPFIETSVDNVDYNIIFYGCTEHEDCTSLALRTQRMSAGRASFEAMNTWNTEQRWTKLYTADVNSAIMEMDFLFREGPMSEASFAAYLDIWDRSVAQFVRFIDDGDYEFVE